MKKEIAYHFVDKTLRNGRPIPPDGEWLVHEGNVSMCGSGLHASRTPWQALGYAPGATLCKVEVEDVVQEDNDKLVCRRRKIIKRFDADSLLRKFARDEALRVIHLWDAPKVVVDYLKTGDESLMAAARSAAGSAAGYAARSAAWSAAWSADGYAARSAAWYAARYAARSAAGDAAGYAAGYEAWSAARSAAGKRFDKLVEEEFERTT